MAIAAMGAAAIGAAYWVGTQHSPPDTSPTTTVLAPGAVRLVAFDSCEAALAELKRTALARVGPWGLDGGNSIMERGAVGAPAEDSAAAPAEGRSQQKDTGYSRTNAHEAAADEPDLVKTDGKRIVSVVDGKLRVVDTASRKVTATLAVPGGYPTQLLLDGDRALVTVQPDGGVITDLPMTDGPTTGRATPMPSGLNTRLVLVDLAGGARVAGSLTVDGAYIDARQVGSVARVVVRSGPRLEFGYPMGDVGEAEATRRNREIIERSTAADWLPRYQLERGSDRTSGQLLDCPALSRSAGHTGTAVLSVLTFDLRADLGTGDAVGIAADGDTVYGTGTSLYVADDHHPRVGILPAEPRRIAAPERSGPPRTEVHQFDVAKPGKPVYLASGAVDGSLLNQYSLSEHNGNLRVATTTEDPTRCCDRTPNSESAVAVLTRRGDTLAVVGRVGGLGKGERIYSVRFLGDTGYVVTFRRTDPLYTIDLADPARPRVTGELKITGYSAYLHPVGAGRLLGVGQEATDQGRTTGTQVSLFDTATRADARRVTQYQLPGASSEAEFDPHAFLYWQEKGLIVVPLDRYKSDGTSNGGALVLRLSGDALTEAGVLAHPDVRNTMVDNRIRRSLVAGGALWTVSASGLLVSDMDSLAQLAWVPFG
ncbi:beta-propeller domain-containing protein [Actinokineospora sp.]|uniref:beta-propeller domain-containing protein n=1 Tax=Actinokineospora sp. TaxID=1872133 RepID=UPI00403782DC